MATLNVTNQQSEATSVFISYAREDAGFVQRLRDSLEQQQIEAKGDWLLTTGEDYKSRLRELNLSSQGLIFIISPDSIKSEECRNELAIAVECRKPILPVAHRDHVDDNLLDSALRAPQWTFMREIDDFGQSLVKLAKAIKTDFGLTAMHGQLLVAADNWASNRNRSYLLQKEGLKKAEAWLARVSAQPDKLPQPTALEVEYIFASRRARTRGTRVALGMSLGIVAVLALLSITALAQRANAVRNAEEAQRQAMLAQQNESTALANATEAQRQKQQADDNALEAGRQKATAEANELTATENAEEARRQQIEAETQRARVQEKSSEIARRLIQADVSNGAQRLESNDPLGALVWFSDALRRETDETQRTLHQIRIGSILRYNAKLIGLNDFQNVQRSKRGKIRLEGRVVKQSDDGKLLLLDAVNGKVLRGPITLPAGTKFSALNKTGDWAVIEHSDKTLWACRINATTLVPDCSRRLKAKEEFEAGEVNSARISDDGKLALIGSDGYNATGVLFDLETGKEIGPIYTTQGAVATRSALSPDNSNLITDSGQSNGAQLYKSLKLDAEGWLPKTQLKTSGWVTDVGFSPDGKLVFAADRDGSVYIWETNTESLVVELKHGVAVKHAAFIAGGKYLASLDEGGVVRVWSFRPYGNERSKLVCPAFRLGIPAVDLIADGRETKITLIDEEGIGTVWDLSDSTKTYENPGIDERLSESKTNGTEEIIINENDRTAQIVNMTNNKPVSSLFYNVLLASFDPTGSLLATGINGSVRVWDASTGEPLTPILPAMNILYLNRIGFSKDGKSLLAQSYAENHTQEWTLTGSPEEVKSLPLWTEILSQRQLASNGRLVRLDAASLKKKWKDYRNRVRIT
jgi:WD40 repeat protein